VKFIRREIGDVVRYYRDKKTKYQLPLKLLLLRGSPKNLPVTAPDNMLTVLQIGSLSAKLQPNA